MDSCLSCTVPDVLTLTETICNEESRRKIGQRKVN